jgi:DEP domain-containing protein 5
VPRTKKTSVPSFGTYISREWETSTPVRNLRRKMSDPDIHHHFAGGLSQSSSSNTSESTNNATHKSERSSRTVSGSGRSTGNTNSGSILRTGRALINPFDPSHVTIKLTSNRRRWTHIFPKGPTGVLIQQHHYQAVPTLTTCPTLQNFADLENGDSEEYAHTSTCAYQFNERSKIEHEMKFVAESER